MNRATQPSPPTTRCHTTMLRVRNLDISVPWYVEKLGAAIEHRDRSYKIVEFRTPCGAHVSIWETREHEKLIPASIESPYIVFVTESATNYRNELVRKGVVATPIVKGLGVDIFWFSDPDNNQFCVLQFNYE
jgi:catechol 2,3-dioxygenase-like lactoylglutathione lyase family enzyme